MPVNKLKIAKNTMLLYIRMGVVLIVSLYTSRIVLHQLGASDYGVNSVVGGIITMLSFMNGTLYSCVQRFYNVYKANNDYESISKVYSSSLVIMVGFALLLLLLAETVGLWFLNNKLNIPSDRMSAANWVYQFSIISAVAGIAAVPFNAMFYSHEDFGIYAFFSVGLAVCNLGISFLLKVAPFDKLIFYSSMLCLLTVLYNTTLCLIAHYKYKEIRFCRNVDADFYKSLLSFSGWNIIGVIMYLMMTYGVNFILNIFFGTIVNAARGLSVQVASKIENFIINVQTATNPQIVQLYSKKEMSALTSLVDDNFRWNFSIYWLIALPLILEIDFILKIWLVDVPAYTAIFTVIIVVHYLLRCFERPVVMLNYATGDVKAMNLFSAASLVLTMILICILFKKGFPPYWAFLLNLFYEAVFLVFKMYKASQYKAFSFRHFIRTIALPVLIVISASVIGAYTIKSFFDEGYLRLIISFVSASLLSGVTIFFVLFTRENRQKIVREVKAKLFLK